MSSRCYIVPNPTGPTLAVSIHEQRCVGCNSCANVCRTQTILPNPEKGRPPVIAYPDECWYCACCVEACPTGALEMHLPINQRIFYKRKENGEIYRIGADDCPPKSYFKPAIGTFGTQRHESVWKMLLRRNRKPTGVWISPSACKQIARQFGEEDTPAADGKTAAMLRRIGFDAVYRWDGTFCNEAKYQRVVILSEDVATCSNAEAVMTPRDVLNMWNEACVSAFTAVTVRNNLPEEIFDV